MLCNAHDDMSNFSIRSKHQRCYTGYLAVGRCSERPFPRHVSTGIPLSQHHAVSTTRAQAVVLHARHTAPLIPSPLVPAAPAATCSALGAWSRWPAMPQAHGDQTDCNTSGVLT